MGECAKSSEKHIGRLVGIGMSYLLYVRWMAVCSREKLKLKLRCRIRISAKSFILLLTIPREVIVLVFSAIAVSLG